MDSPGPAKKSITKRFLDNLAGSFSVSGYLMFLLLSFITYNWGPLVPSSCLLIAFTFHSTISPDQRVTSIAYGILLLSTVSTLSVYHIMNVEALCKSPFPHHLSTHPSVSAFKPVVDVLNWTCAGLDSVSNSSALSMDDDECFQKSDILSLQRGLIEVIRYRYKDMGADKQIIDFLDVVDTNFEKGDFTKLESFDRLPNGSPIKKTVQPY